MRTSSCVLHVHVGAGSGAVLQSNPFLWRRRATSCDGLPASCSTHAHFYFYFVLNYNSQDAPQQIFSNQSLWRHQQMMIQVFLTCGSSIVLRFSRWMSHGSDERSGRNGCSFGSWLSLGATMVIGGWERKSKLRWASRDRCSTEAPPTSCQKNKLESVKKICSNNLPQEWHHIK